MKTPLPKYGVFNPFATPKAPETTTVAPVVVERPRADNGKVRFTGQRYNLHVLVPSDEDQEMTYEAITRIARTLRRIEAVQGLPPEATFTAPAVDKLPEYVKFDDHADELFWIRAASLIAATDFLGAFFRKVNPSLLKAFGIQANLKG